MNEQCQTTEEMIKVMEASLEGRVIERREYTCDSWFRTICPHWNWSRYDYREATVKPSVNWYTVDSRIIALAMDEDGTCNFFYRVPVIMGYSWYSGGTRISAEVFSSFVEGQCNWKDSLVVRPGYTQEQDQETP